MFTVIPVLKLAMLFTSGIHNSFNTQISVQLVRIFAQDFNLSIVENKGNFFGMSVYPSEATCEKLIDSLVNAKDVDYGEKADTEIDFFENALDKRIIGL